MPFLQATFCFKGFDDRNRYFLISLVSLLSFVFLSTLFSQYFFINIVILLILTTALTASTTRRLRDAQLSKNWQLVPGVLLLITGLISLNIDSSSRYYLLILPIMSIALLLTYPSKSNVAKGKYIFGYAGPVDLSMYQQKQEISAHHNQRIEPTLLASGLNEQVSTSEIHDSLVAGETSMTESDESQADIGELIRLKLLNNRKFQIAIIASVTLILLSVFIHSALNSNSSSSSKTNEVEHTEEEIHLSAATSVTLERNHPLVMPDDFTLYLSEYNGISIHWQADQTTNGEIWSQRSASGEENCQKMSFNKGKAIRPLNVVVENGINYFAHFSPLDSRELIKALAYRGNFTLCGYPFSLKGTQALLGKHNQYAQFLETTE